MGMPPWGWALIGAGAVVLLIGLALAARAWFTRPAPKKKPANGWFWKRLLAWAVIVAAHAGVGAIIILIRDPTALMWLGLALVAEALVVFTFYFAGATVTDWAELAGKIAPGVNIGFGGVRAGETATPPRAPTGAPKGAKLPANVTDAVAEAAARYGGKAYD